MKLLPISCPLHRLSNRDQNVQTIEQVAKWSLTLKECYVHTKIHILDSPNLEGKNVLYRKQDTTYIYKLHV